MTPKHAWQLACWMTPTQHAAILLVVAGTARRLLEVSERVRAADPHAALELERILDDLAEHATGIDMPAEWAEHVRPHPAALERLDLFAAAMVNGERRAA